MLKTILVISLAALSLNAFAECEDNTNKIEVFSKAKESRKSDSGYDSAESLALEAAVKKALQDCVMKGAKGCQQDSSLTYCESKWVDFGEKNFKGTCTVVVRGYKTKKTKAEDGIFRNLCEE